MGRARDNKLARHNKAVMLKLHRRQDSGTCPAIAPQDCQPLADCCPLSSECIALANGGTGCVVSNNQGQTLTLTPQPKVSPTSAPATITTSDVTTTPSTLTTVPITTTSSIPPAPVPTTTSTTPAPLPTITSSPATISSIDTSTFISSLPTTIDNPTSSIASLPSGTTPPSGFTTASSSSTTAPGVIGGQSPPAPGNDAKEANLNKDQITALVVAPLSAILLAIIAYFIWRKRKARSQTPTTAAPASYGGHDNDDDRQPMATTLLDRRIGSTRSTRTQNSMATTDILLRASEDGVGPLRSHPISLAPMMLGAIPQSPLSTNKTDKSDDSSFKSAAAKNDESEEGSSGSSPILAPFGQEYIHGHIRYSSAPMKYVTRLDAGDGAAAPTEAGEAADIEGSQTSPTGSQTRHMSWMMNPFGRSSSTIPSTSRTVTPGDWITPSTRVLEDQRVSSVRSDGGDGVEWKSAQGDEKEPPGE